MHGGILTGDISIASTILTTRVAAQHSEGGIVFDKQTHKRTLVKTISPSLRCAARVVGLNIEHWILKILQYLTALHDEKFAWMSFCIMVCINYAYSIGYSS